MNTGVTIGIEGNKPGHSGFDSRIEQPRLQFSKYVGKPLQHRHDTIDAFTADPNRSYQLSRSLHRRPSVYSAFRIGRTDQRSPSSAVRKQRPDGTTTELTLGHRCQTSHVDDSVRVLAVTAGQHVSWERMRDW